MDKRAICFTAILGAFFLFPDTILATTTDSFGGQEIYAKGTEIKGFLLGPVTRFAAILGLGWGVMQAVMSSAIRPLLFWGAIAVTVSVGSGVVDKVFPENTALISDLVEGIEEWNEGM